MAKGREMGKNPICYEEEERVELKVQLEALV